MDITVTGQNGTNAGSGFPATDGDSATIVYDSSVDEYASYVTLNATGGNGGASDGDGADGAGGDATIDGTLVIPSSTGDHSGYLYMTAVGGNGGQGADATAVGSTTAEIVASTGAYVTGGTGVLRSGNAFATATSTTTATDSSDVYRTYASADASVSSFADSDNPYGESSNSPLLNFGAFVDIQAGTGSATGHAAIINTGPAPTFDTTYEGIAVAVTLPNVPTVTDVSLDSTILAQGEIGGRHADSAFSYDESEWTGWRFALASNQLAGSEIYLDLTDATLIGHVSYARLMINFGTFSTNQDFYSETDLLAYFQHQMIDLGSIDDMGGGRIDGSIALTVDSEQGGGFFADLALAAGAPCFLAGTLILTDHGERPVEAFAIGDGVMASDGRALSVRWIGRSTVSTRFADPLRVLPIRIKAGALGDNLPRRDLLVSPDHALLVDDLLIQAGALVNGTSIIRDSNVPEVFTYYHIELAEHALILAEGTPAETFVDNVSRMAFDNWAEHDALYGDAPITEMEYPRAQSHRQVPMDIRARLITHAQQLFGHPIPRRGPRRADERPGGIMQRSGGSLCLSASNHRQKSRLE